MITSSKQAMIRDNKSDVGSWVMRLVEDPEFALAFFGDTIKKECDLFTPSMLQQAYDPDRTTKVTVNGLSRELKRAGLRQVNKGGPVRTALGLQRLYAIRNAEKWIAAEPSELSAHFNTHWGNGGKF